MSTPTNPPRPTDDVHEWLALYRAPGIGTRGLHKLLQDFDSPAAIFAADRDHLLARGLAAATAEYLQRPDWQAVEKDLAWLNGGGNRLLTIRDKAYPPRLADTADPPLLLFVRLPAATPAGYRRQPQPQSPRRCAGRGFRGLPGRLRPDDL